MSELDKKALDANFAVWKEARAPELPDDKAFERYCVEQILKDSDLSDEDLDFGDFGGGDDGGIDAMYLFMNTMLITDETELPDPTTSVELVLIQATRESGFSEERVEKMHAFARDLLNYATPVSKLTYLNSDARQSIGHFREKYDKVLGSPHTLRISFHYACRSITEANTKVEKRIDNLKAFVKSRLSAANISVILWGSVSLLESARRVPSQEEVIPINGHMATSDGSVVCLVGLNDFATFLKDPSGNIKTRMLEPNVRDYQGKRNPVNAQIRTTLNEKAAKEEFWWLNNGITILATKCSISGNKLTVTTPEIVNGLQTSHEIFAVFGSSPWTDPRSVLVRIILPTEEQSRNQIIKATNSQTPVDALSLRATDRIHLDIEDRLKAYGPLFYDRRKGEYRRLRKPISKIISVRALAQACIAVLLQEPDNARARPQTVLKNDTQYGVLFDESNNRDFYAASILLDRQVEDFLTKSNLTREEKRDIRYYMDMLLSCELTGMAKPSVAGLAAVIKKFVDPLPDEVLKRAAYEVLDTYRKLGGTDTVAKGTNLRSEVVALVKTKYPVPPSEAAAN